MPFVVPKTGNYILQGGTLVINKTQQARLRKAKTAKTRKKIIANVSRRKAKMSKGRK
jgi:hypothetical protein